MCAGILIFFWSLISKPLFGGKKWICWFVNPKSGMILLLDGAGSTLVNRAFWILFIDIWAVLIPSFFFLIPQSFTWQFSILSAIDTFQMAPDEHVCLVATLMVNNSWIWQNKSHVFPAESRKQTSDSSVKVCVYQSRAAVSHLLEVTSVSIRSLFWASNRSKLWAGSVGVLYNVTVNIRNLKDSLSDWKSVSWFDII